MIEIVLNKHSFYHRKQDIIDWCVECFDKHFGQSFPYRWGYSVSFGNGIFYFENTNDAMMFKLRWIGTDEKR